MKKIIAVLLSAILLLGLLTASASAAEDSKCGEALAQTLVDTVDNEMLDVYVEYQFSVTPKEELEQRAREICNYPEDERSATMEQVNEFIRTYRRLVHEDRVNSATAVMKKLGIYDNIVMLQYSPDRGEHVPVVDIDNFFYGIPSAPCRFILSAAKIRDLLTKEEVTFADLYILENLQWYKDFYQKTDEPEPTEEWQFANAFYRFVQAEEASDYTYEELYYHYQDDIMDWVLVRALPNRQEPAYVPTILPIGGRIIEGDLLRMPFMTSYGVYHVSENKFYGLEQLSETYNNYNGLVEALEAFNIGTQSGDNPDNDFQNNFVEWSVFKYGKECLAEGYRYNELYKHFTKDENDWVLIDAEYFLDQPAVETWIHIGGRNIMSGSLCAPFKCCYGIYDVEQNTFYDLGDLAKDYSKYNGLIETLDALKIGNLTGDVNLDNTVSISDVTSIQRKLAEYEKYSNYQCGLSDVNNDGEVTITDATAIQLYLAQLITDFG